MRTLLLSLGLGAALAATACGGDAADDNDDDLDAGDEATDSETGDEATDSETDSETGDEATDSDTGYPTGPCTEYATVFPLQAGDCVPDFELPAHDGTSVQLFDLRGQWVVFSSFPAVGTSVCTGQMQKLDELYDDFVDAGIQPYGLNNEPPDQKDEWCETIGVEKLLVLSDHDPKDAVGAMFGINGAWTQRADTVIDADGRFIFKRPSSGAPSVPPLLEDVKALIAARD